MYFLTEPIEIDQPLYEFEGYLHSRYQASPGSRTRGFRR
jgi:hypothetical protein